jgi:hypothetical protein
MFDGLRSDQHTWTVHFYKIYNSSFPLATIDSSELLVVPFLAAAPMCVWDPSASRRRRGAAVEPDEGDADDLDDRAIEDAVDDEGGDVLDDEDLDEDVVCGPEDVSLKFLALELELAIEAIDEGSPPILEPEDRDDDPPVHVVHHGGAVGSGDPMPHLVAHAAHHPEPSQIIVKFGCGTITWYKSSNTLVGACSVHGKACRFTKTVDPKRNMNPAAGRCAGRIAAWLLMLDPSEGGNPLLSLGDHVFSKKLLVAFAARRRARTLLHLADGSEALFAKEKPVEPFDDSEPDGDP